MAQIPLAERSKEWFRKLKVKRRRQSTNYGQEGSSDLKWPRFINNLTAKEYITNLHTCRPINSGGRRLCLITTDNKRLWQYSCVFGRPLCIAEYACSKMYIFRAVNNSGSFTLFCLVTSKTVRLTEK
jgi:hypothetical protein